MAQQTGPTQQGDPRSSRRYRIRGLIGRGGFGAVYRATLIGDDGFEKDVAVKLLHPDRVDPPTLARFRDEARILGLVRDRAVVGVDPPTRLEGRWALVMELADGVSLSRILKRIDVLPPRLVAEIVEEVARALHSVYRQPGPDGEPLSLLHRDLKPGNLQITPAGSVKVLDFGIAKADFDAREAETSSHIVGTYKYMAPERLLGQEVPAGDVYSLGVVLRRAAFGERPLSPGVFQPPEEAPTEQMDLPESMHLLKGLALRMTALDPKERPTAREVERQCRALTDSLPGPRLRDWTEANIPRDLPLREDELVGTLLTETHALESFDAASLPGVSPSEPVDTTAGWASRVPAGLLAMAAGLITASGAVGLLAAGLVYLAYPSGGADTSVPGAAVVAPPSVPGPQPPLPPEPKPEPAPNTAPESDPAPEPDPVDTPDAAPPSEDPDHPEDVNRERAPAPDPEPTAGSGGPSPQPPTPVSSETPEPADPEPAPDVPRHPITIGSNPAGATVFVDGFEIGETPIVGHPLAEGRHSLKLSLPDREMIQSITVGPNRPVRYMWVDGTWKSFL